MIRELKATIDGAGTKPTHIDLTDPTEDATVRFDGRAVLIKEDDNLWCAYGVQPGGFDAEGDTPYAALIEMKETLKGIVCDIHSDEDTKGRDLRKFLDEINEWAQKRYEEGSKLGQLAFTYTFSCREVCDEHTKG